MIYAEDANVPTNMKVYGVFPAKMNATRDPEFQAAMKRMANLRARLTELANMSGGIADKIVGSSPEKGEGSSVSPVANGAIQELNSAINDLESATETAYRHVSRIGSEF